MKFNVLTNKKPAKDWGEQLIAVTGSVPGFKLTAAAARKLAVAAGDYVTIVESPEGGSFYVAKGKDGGESGNNVGGKLATAGSNFGFSSANAFKALGMDNMHVHYSLAEEAVEGEFEWSDSPVPCYLLTRESESQPQRRGSKATASADTATDSTEDVLEEKMEAVDSQPDVLEDNALNEL